MKLIIDIPEKEYDLLKFCGEDFSPLYKAIANGIPLEDIKAEIEEEIHKNGYDIGYGLAIAKDIIDKHIGVKNDKRRSN